MMRADYSMGAQPTLALSLTHNVLCVLSMDTWWNFGHELKKISRRLL